MADLRPRWLVDRRTLDGGAVCFWRHVDFCAAGTMCAVCRDFKPPSEPTETCELQPGEDYTKHFHSLSSGCLSANRIIPLISPHLLFPRWRLSLAPPVSSSVVWCQITWRTLRPSKPSQCWSLSWAVSACSTRASTVRAALITKDLNWRHWGLLIRLPISQAFPSPC